ncbi:uncharacterized protein LOC142605751 [Castanea sativa]|uniref:uncharacterized protein LOC142605751 n=1 Tax=Castanea sativa TaxID=21020 RepID=UPI003F64EA8D
MVVESYHSDRAGRRRLHTGDQVSNDDELQKMQLKIDYLRKRLKRRRNDRRSPSFSSSDSSAEGKRGDDHQVSKFSPSESGFVSSFVGKSKKGVGKRAEGWSYQGTGNDTMSKALRQISKSPFVKRINKAKLPYRFSQPVFTIYNGRTDPVEHVSHFNQKMAVHSNNEALICKVFPSSLGPVAMRWFDALEEGSIGSFQELTRAFGAQFITCSRVPKPLDALLSMAMREGETFKTYSNRYWETYNGIDGDLEDVVVRTFKVGLLTEHGLRKSLKMKAASNMRQLMDCIDKYKRVEEDQIQGKGKAKMFPERKDPRGVGYQGNRPKRDFSGHSLPVGTPLVNSFFKELVHQILEKIWNESYFRWPNKMSGDVSLRNQSLHCHYHQDKGHTMEECRTLHDHLNQLARAGKLNHFLSRQEGQFGHQGAGSHRGNTPRPALDTINVILAKPGRELGASSRVMSVWGGPGEEAVKRGNQMAKRVKLSATPVLGFSE